MRAEWTGRLIGEMHIRGIKQKDLAKAAGITNAYCGMILNGKRKPQGAHKRLEDALKALTGGAA